MDVLSGAHALSSYLQLQNNLSACHLFRFLFHNTVNERWDIKAKNKQTNKRPEKDNHKNSIFRTKALRATCIFAPTNVMECDVFCGHFCTYAPSAEAGTCLVGTVEAVTGSSSCHLSALGSPPCEASPSAPSGAMNSGISALPGKQTARKLEANTKKTFTRDQLRYVYAHTQWWQQYCTCTMALLIKTERDFVIETKNILGPASDSDQVWSSSSHKQEGGRSRKALSA